MSQFKTVEFFPTASGAADAAFLIVSSSVIAANAAELTITAPATNAILNTKLITSSFATAVSAPEVVRCRFDCPSPAHVDAPRIDITPPNVVAKRQLRYPMQGGV